MLSCSFFGRRTETACLPGFTQPTSAFGNNSNPSNTFGSGGAGGSTFGSSTGGTLETIFTTIFALAAKTATLANWRLSS